jgi:hypothetical protein
MNRDDLSIRNDESRCSKVEFESRLALGKDMEDCGPLPEWVVAEILHYQRAHDLSSCAERSAEER